MQERYEKMEKIFMAWEKLESIDRKILEVELKRLVEVGHMNFALVTTLSAYWPFVKEYIANEELNIPYLLSFFKEVKNISEEAYQFMIEGFDIINMKQIIISHDENNSEVIEQIVGAKDIGIFIEHAFIKILNEPDKNKKHIMLRGLIGM